MRLPARAACIVGLAFAASFALLPACSASAAFLTPEYATTWAGSGDHVIGEATAVAVDEATHDVYVADRGKHRVEVFDAAGNFLFMFGDGVDETTPGNKCPVEPGDVCREGQSLSASFPDLTNPTAIAVDNSDSSAAGAVYVAEGTSSGGDGTLARFDSGGQLDPGWGGDGTINVLDLQKMGVSPFDGTVWVFDGEVSGSPGGVAGAQVSAYDTSGTRKFRREQAADSGGDGNIAVDSGGRLWFADHGPRALIEDVATFGSTAGYPLGQVYPGAAQSFAVNPVNSDVLATFNGWEVLVFERNCEPSRGYCNPKEGFGGGNLSQPRGLAIDGSTGAVYVAMEGGVAVFHSKVVPDVVPKPASVGITDAVLSAHLDPHGAGDITGCEVEYGTTEGYGTTVPCDQTMPLSEAGDVSVHLEGLQTETPYHYRFRATNANGTSNGPDRIFTPHWVKGLETGEATDIGPGSATLHGELNPNGEATHYFFEWGATTQYGHTTPAPPGSITSASGLTQVSVRLNGELTSSSTYHFRLVGSNSLGTSYGADREFTTPLAEAPQIRNLSGVATGLTTATLHAEIDPGFGATAYRFQYGHDTSYGTSTVIVGPFGDDGGFHPVQAELSGLTPGATYHFRVIAFNFSKYVASGDSSFMTLSPPSTGVGGGEALIAPPVAQPPATHPRCAKGKVRRKGRCVRRHRKHRRHRPRGHHRSGGRR